VACFYKFYPKQNYICTNLKLASSKAGHSYVRREPWHGSNELREGGRGPKLTLTQRWHRQGQSFAQLSAGGEDDATDSAAVGSS
jgi:hypothetical protein